MKNLSLLGWMMRRKSKALKEEYKIVIDARKLEHEVNESFNLDGLREHYNLSLTQALKIKKLLDKDKQEDIKKRGKL